MEYLDLPMSMYYTHKASGGYKAAPAIKIVHLLIVTIVLSPIVAASHVRKKTYFIQMK